MFGVLVESRARRRRSLGGTAFSVVAHVAVIGAAIAATAGAEIDRPAKPDYVPLVLPAPVDPPPRRAVSSRSESDARQSSPEDPLPTLPSIQHTPVGVPDPSPVPLDLSPISFGSGRHAAAISDTGAGRGGGESHVYFEGLVDRAARARAGNPAPVYPRMLRNARIEGTVLAQFVIDTVGRADMSSFRVLASGHTLFAEAVRDAVSRMRFEPAMVGDRAVRVLVQQSFAFRMSR